MIRNISDVITKNAVELDKEAIVDGDNRYSYREFERRINQLAAGLITTGIQKGDRIVIQLKNRIEYLDLYMATARIGAILVGINYNYKAAEIQDILKDSKPSLIVAGEEFVEGFDMADTQGIPCFVVGNARGRWKTFESLYYDLNPELERIIEERRNLVNKDDPVLVIYTSGSTGKPKGVLLSHHNIISNISVQNEHFHVRKTDRMLLHLPMNHVGGATETFFSMMMAGGTVVLMESFHPVKALELVQKEKITILGQVPTMYIMQFSLPNFSDYDLSSLRVCIVAGATTPTEVMKKLMKMAPVAQTGYGMSEVGGFITYTDPNDPPEVVARTVGKIAKEFSMKIVDENKRPVPPGEIGEIAVKGDCVMLGYLNNQEETAKVIDEEGWFYTGDMGKIDNNGNLVLAGRRKEMFICGGYNVYPAEVEEYLSRHPAVKLCAVVGVPDEKYGEVGKAYVVLHPQFSVDERELVEYLSERIADYKIPKHFVFRDELPLTPLGKVNKKLL